MVHTLSDQIRVAASMPFGSAEEAWFWTARSLAARHEGVRRQHNRSTPRPCDPDDVLVCLGQLHRAGRITLAHARVLRRWGAQGKAPDASRACEAADARLWCEVFDRLTPVLRAKAIVAPDEAWT